MISSNEMRMWISHISTSSAQKITDENWLKVNPLGKESITWDEYIDRSYGFMEEQAVDPIASLEFSNQLRDDQRRWKAADQNKDTRLFKSEFHNFLHPDMQLHMRDAVIDALLEVADKNKDGLLSEIEYLDEVARAYQIDLKAGSSIPEWMSRERDQFHRYRDPNGDGVMNRDEVGDWVMPADYDTVEAEVQHLFYYVDSNKDEQITPEEIFAKEQMFVNSQATNYGTALEELDSS